MRRRSTQRNLSNEGVQQSRQLWSAFSNRRVYLNEALSSRYWRCRETAQMAFNRMVEPNADLDAASEDTLRRQEQAAALQALIAKPVEKGSNRGIVTHSANIADATGESLEMGEILVLRPGGDSATVVGRVKVQ